MEFVFTKLVDSIESETIHKEEFSTFTTITNFAGSFECSFYICRFKTKKSLQNHRYFTYDVDVRNCMTQTIAEYSVYSIFCL